MLMRCVAALAALAAARALDNGLARTPPMGWMTWLGFGCNIDCKNFPKTCISENLIKRTADAMVADGYLAAGYQYVIVDDCWLARNRSSDNRLQPDPERFPSGIKALADYVHGKGLKFGIYQDIGTKTCAVYPGIAEFGELDAQTFADWGVDYIKIDGCFMDPKEFDTAYPRFGSYLNKTGRPMLYSCSWPAYQTGNMKVDYESIAKNCNIWRNYDDIRNYTESLWEIVDWYGSHQNEFMHIAGPGAFNDPDQLVGGSPKIDDEDAAKQLIIWAILAAPLIMSTDLEKISKERREKLFLNEKFIAINQDPLGKQGKRVEHNKEMDTWTRELSGDRIVTLQIFWNKSLSSMEVPLAYVLLPGRVYEVEDITDKDKPKKLLSSKSKFYAEYDGDLGAKLYLFTPVPEKQVNIRYADGRWISMNDLIIRERRESEISPLLSSDYADLPNKNIDCDYYWDYHPLCNLG